MAQKNWLTEDELVQVIAVAESTPGPIAVNMATFVGATQAGFPGSLAATLGVVLPFFLIILSIASVLRNFTGNSYSKGFLKGIKPVIAALILSTGVTLLAGTTGFTQLQPDWISIGIFAVLCGIWFL